MNTDAITDIAQAERGTSLWQDAWLRLRRNRLAVMGLIVLVLFIVIALITPWIAPYSYQAQNLELGASPPSAQHWLGTDIFGRDLLTQPGEVGGQDGRGDLDRAAHRGRN